MSVIQMQKVRLSVYRHDVNQALLTIQKTGALEFTPTKMDNLSEPTDSFKHADLLPRVQHAVQFLAPYAPKQSLWKTLREGTRDEVTEEELLQMKANITDVAYPLVDDFERLQVEFAEVNEKLRVLEERHTLLNTWKNLPLKLNQFETTLTKTLLIVGNADANENLKAKLETALVEAGISYSGIEVDAQAVAVSVSSDADSVKTAKEVIEKAGGELVTLPKGAETPEVEFVAVSEALAAVKGELALLHDQAEHFAITHLKRLQVSGEILTWQKDRHDVVDSAKATNYAVFFDGWLNKGKREAIEAEFKEKDLAAVFSELELGEDETPPVDIENNKFFQPFEAVTRLYGMPGHKDLDPTAFLAAFFFLFFGLSLTDVGYGLFLMVVSAMIIFLFKVSDSLRLFAKLLFLVGLATVLVGALFGGYFGVDPSTLPPFFQAIQLFDPIGNPLPVFYLALGLGVFQVMVGMLVKIYSEYTQGRLMTGIMDQGPWFFVFCMAILALLTSIGYVAIVPMATVINLIYVGLALVVISAGRKGDTIFVKIKDALSALYDSIGYFSDILSYSRLLALGLATTALAFAVNMIAGMVFNADSYITYIFAAAVLIIGHLFTLAVNTLGAFIHSARLQFVEFFGKFIDGTGREFHPLSRTEEHITVKKK